MNTDNFGSLVPSYISFMEAHNHLTRLVVTSILYNCRICKVQKQALDVLTQLLGQVIFKLMRQTKSMVQSEHPAIPFLLVSKAHVQGQVVGRTYPDQLAHTSRDYLSFIMDSIMLIDFFTSNFVVNGGKHAMYSLFRTEGPSYGLLELLDFARAQLRLFPTRSLSNSSNNNINSSNINDEDGDHIERRAGQQSMADSVYEQAGLLNVEYRLVPRPSVSKVDIFLANSLMEDLEE